MLRRHGLPLILLAAAVSVAGCSRSGTENISATDNTESTALTNDIVANDEEALPDNEALANDVLSDNAAIPAPANAN
ncbi:hypothetical protein [Sphingomonas sp. Leaf21]|uniref:hypothetical protein n=1 Tax=Sphingomonas sp. Leaf21 TaxID=2876550 RepID=UPI001E356E7B|nr:hypothetical protein [Sphingomonas sp. Leaf21]